MLLPQKLLIEVIILFIILLKNGIDLTNTSNSSSTSNSTSTSSSSNDIPLTRIYKTLHNGLNPSSSTKTSKNPDDVDAPESLSIEDRMGNIVQMRIDSCKNLPLDHPLQPAYLKPLQVVMSDEKVESESPKVTSNIPES